MFPGAEPPLGVERSLALYDGEIRRTDDAVGELLERIDRSAGPAGTTIVLTADHGDEFLERGNWHHTKTVYDELARVPLIVVLAGGRGGRVGDTPVSLADLMPTLLDLADANPDAAAEGLSPAPLLANRNAGDDVASRGLYGETRRWARLDRRYWMEGSHKLMGDLEAGTRALYDVVADPGERTDLAPTEPAAADRMQRALDEHLSHAERARHPVPLRRADDADRPSARTLTEEAFSWKVKACESQRPVDKQARDSSRGTGGTRDRVAGIASLRGSLGLRSVLCPVVDAARLAA